MPLVFGSHIGRIRIDALIGAGGMGEVYRGWDERLERTVAIKVIQPNKLVDAGVRTRFLREARLLSKLDHPNICRIYDVIEDESGSYLVLELIEGRTLRAAVAEGIGRDDAIQIALQIARVLALAHGRGIVHRDLKPDNVMLTRDGEVKVLDFGLARLVQQDDGGPALDLAVTETDKTAIIEPQPEAFSSIDWTRTSAGTLVGTVHYMSPEQARGLPLTAASDLYSLGIVLYELLSHGRSPYGKTPSTTDLLSKVRKADVELTDGGDRDAMRLVRRLTDADPEKRPTAAETARDLERIASKPERVRRNAMLGATIALIVIIAVLVIVTMQRAADQPVFTQAGQGKIAVLPFRNETHQRGTEWIELGLMDMVMQGLGGMRQGQLVPADDVLKSMKNLGIRRGADLAPPMRARLLDALGADALLEAAVTTDSRRYDVRYRLRFRDRDESTRDVDSAALPDAANELAARLSHRLDPTAQKIDIRDRYSFDDFANVSYAIGLQQYLTKGPQAATPYFTVCVDRDREFAWAKLQLARCRNLAGDIAGTDALLDEAQKLAVRKDDRRLASEVDLVRADNALERGDYAIADRLARASIHVSRKLGDLKMLGHGQRILGIVAWHQSRPADARARFAEAARTFDSLRSTGDRARTHINVGILDTEAGDYESAKHNYAEALSIGERLNDREVIVKVLGNLAYVALKMRDFPGAERFAARELAITRQSGDRANEMYALVNLALSVYGQGRETESIAMTEQARTIASQLHNPRVEAIALVNLAFARTVLGQLDVAGKELDAAETITNTLGNPDATKRLAANRAYWLTRSGRLDEAARYLAKAEEITETLGVLSARARLLYARADYRGAEATMRRAKALNQGWFPSQEKMLAAYADAAKSGKPSTIAFELPVTH